MSVLVVDFGMGTVGNVARALMRVGADVKIGTDVGLNGIDAYVFPGIGHFGHCMELLRDGRIDLLGLRSRIEGGHKLLGICVGAQMLFNTSQEAPLGPPGLGWLPGEVKRVEGRAPRIGWFPVNISSHSVEYFYFVHSYTIPQDIVRQGSITAVQFHPEKSGKAGRQFLKEWLS